jgi:hypothetical protein
MHLGILSSDGGEYTTTKRTRPPPISLGLTCERNTNQAFNSQAPWATSTPPPTELSAQAKVTLFQLMIVVLIVDSLNVSTIHLARRHFAHDPAAQQLIYQSLLRVLVLGDVAHIAATFYAMEPAIRWRLGSWSPLMWTTVVAVVSFLVIRILWLCGVGRDVIKKDGRERKVE